MAKRKRGKPQGVKVGRRGSVLVYRGGKVVKALNQEMVLSMIGRKV